MNCSTRQARTFGEEAGYQLLQFQFQDKSLTVTSEAIGVLTEHWQCHSVAILDYQPLLDAPMPKNVNFLFYLSGLLKFGTAVLYPQCVISFISF